VTRVPSWPRHLRAPNAPSRRRSSEYFSDCEAPVPTRPAAIETSAAVAASARRFIELGGAIGGPPDPRRASRGVESRIRRVQWLTTSRPLSCPAASRLPRLWTAQRLHHRLQMQMWRCTWHVYLLTRSRPSHLGLVGLNPRHIPIYRSSRWGGGVDATQRTAKGEFAASRAWPCLGPRWRAHFATQLRASDTILLRSL